ncbi:hypothetical protein M0805_009859 [Coniferiporia weirii]|nr:hypothetical protein M0805_009859 [Coniferiporia weirii]
MSFDGAGQLSGEIDSNLDSGTIPGFKHETQLSTGDGVPEKKDDGEAREPEVLSAKERTNTGEEGVEEDEPTEPTPSRWRRLLTIILSILFLWFVLTFLSTLNEKRPPKVVYSNRYSEDFKFRPAASPIVTESLKDGRVRLRGAQPTILTTPTPIPIPKSTRKSKSRKSKKSKSSR